MNVSLPLHKQITRRETEVLIWLEQGKRNREIAIILGVSPATVKTHVERILGKLGCETRTSAVLCARSNGVLSAAFGNVEIS